jgi:folate-binding protein YgfZ
MNAPDPAAPLVIPSAPVVCAHTASALIEVAGDDAIAFLHGQLSSDVQALGPGQGQNGSYNSPKGRMLANGVLWRPAGGAADRVLMLLSSDLVEPIRRRLSMFVLRTKAVIQDVRERHALLGVAGVDGAAAARDALGVVVAPMTAVRFGADATALALPDGRIVVACAVTSGPLIHAALARNAAIADAETWRWFGIAAGVPTVTAPTSDLFVPQAANWDLLGGVSFKKGCYPGQEIVARMQYLGRLKERLYAFRAETEDIAAGTRLFSAAFGDDQRCGTIVNAARDTASGSVLLAVVQDAAAAAQDVRLGATDGPLLKSLALPYAVPDRAPPPRAPRMA